MSLSGLHVRREHAPATLHVPCAASGSPGGFHGTSGLGGAQTSVDIASDPPASGSAKRPPKRKAACPLARKLRSRRAKRNALALEAAEDECGAEGVWTKERRCCPPLQALHPAFHLAKPSEALIKPPETAESTQD